MKTRRKYLFYVLLVIATVLLAGWATSTRHVDMRFLNEGVPLSGRSIEIFGPKKGLETDIFEISEDGWVRLPSSYVGKTGACKIQNGDIAHEFLRLGFSRGKSVVNFTSSGIESEYTYRFLFYESQTIMKPLP